MDGEALRAVVYNLLAISLTLLLIVTHVTNRKLADSIHQILDDAEYIGWISPVDEESTVHDGYKWNVPAIVEDELNRLKELEDNGN